MYATKHYPIESEYMQVVLTNNGIPVCSFYVEHYMVEFTDKLLNALSHDSVTPLLQNISNTCSSLGHFWYESEQLTARLSALWDRVYTNQGDTLSAMACKNPALLKLVSNFKLDFDL